MATTSAERPPTMDVVAVAFVAATGVLLGVLQWSAFFLLQSYVASTAIIYLLATTAWLVGSVAGMLAPARRDLPWLVAALAAYYGLRALAGAHPYAFAWLPVLLGLVVVMGAFAGRFFRVRAATFASAKWLFFWENTGFVAGMLITTVALYYAGDAFFVAGPAAAAAVVAALGVALDRA